ncbi:MAG: DUF167 domain-containing protein [Pseudomonadota bacterium]
MKPQIHEKDGGLTLECIVSPRAGRSAIKGVRDGALLVALAAPPVEGRANEILVRFIAELLSISPSRVGLVRGGRSRKKLLFISGIDKKAALKKLYFMGE